MGESWGLLGAILKPLLEGFAVSWDCLGGSWGGLGVVLGWSWEVLGWSWGSVGVVLGGVGSCWVVLGHFFRWIDVLKGNHEIHTFYVCKKVRKMNGLCGP